LAYKYESIERKADHGWSKQCALKDYLRNGEDVWFVGHPQNPSPRLFFCSRNRTCV
jgi:hypothetical protein